MTKGLMLYHQMLLEIINKERKAYYYGLMKLINKLRNSDLYFDNYYIAREAILKTWKFEYELDGTEIIFKWMPKIAEEISAEIDQRIQEEKEMRYSWTDEGAYRSVPVFWDGDEELTYDQVVDLLNKKEEVEDD